jgi:hypothetical protein
LEAAILSLALALGVCMSAFRIIDAMLWRPLPVVGAEQLFVLARSSAAFGGVMREYDGARDGEDFCGSSRAVLCRHSDVCGD